MTNNCGTLGQKVALKHTTKTTANDQLASLFLLFSWTGSANQNDLSHVHAQMAKKPLTRSDLWADKVYLMRPLLVTLCKLICVCFDSPYRFSWLS